MKSILAYERRLQDIERQLQNAFRVGKIQEVKFENQRWFVRLWDGNGTERQTFKTDWIPWKSFAHGSISFSVPPRIGQSAAIQSPGGYGELSYCEPYHYNPDNPSPHDKENEVMMRIQPAQNGQGGGGGGGQGGGQGAQLAQPDGNGNQNFVTVQGTDKFLCVKAGQSMIYIGEDRIEIASPTIVIRGNAIEIKAMSLTKIVKDLLYDLKSWLIKSESPPVITGNSFDEGKVEYKGPGKAPGS